MKAASYAVMASRDASADTVDFFPTPPWAGRAVGELIGRLDPGARSVWEPACGAGHLAHGLRDHFARVHETDAYDYGGTVRFDFLSQDEPPCRADWIVTNPPFSHVEAFARLGWARARRGVALLCRLQVQEGQGRFDLLTRDCPLTACAVFSERLAMGRGRWDPDLGTASAYAWFIWRKNRRGRASARLEWIAPGSRARLSRASDLRFAVQEDAA